MLDIGWSEMAVIAVIALLVIGPKDLPKAMRTVSQWVRRARALAQEFQSGLDEIAREAELDEVKRQVTAAADFDIEAEMEKTIDPTGSMREAADVSKDLQSLDAPRDTMPADPATAGKADATPVSDADAADPMAPTATDDGPAVDAPAEEETGAGQKQQASA